MLLSLTTLKVNIYNAFIVLHSIHLTFPLNIVSGIIPHIRKHAPDTKIIFRSHIEIRSDLITNEPEGSTANTWKYVYMSI